MLFLTDKVVSEGLTFDDILLILSNSDVLHREVEFASWITGSHRIQTPLVIAAMDTITCKNPNYISR